MERKVMCLFIVGLLMVACLVELEACRRCRSPFCIGLGGYAGNLLYDELEKHRCFAGHLFHGEGHLYHGGGLPYHEGGLPYNGGGLPYNGGGFPYNGGGPPPYHGGGLPCHGGYSYPGRGHAYNGGGLPCLGGGNAGFGYPIPIPIAVPVALATPFPPNHRGYGGNGRGDFFDDEYIPRRRACRCGSSRSESRRNNSRGRSYEYY